jgi:hypothetical protein
MSWGLLGPETLVTERRTRTLNLGDQSDLADFDFCAAWAGVEERLKYNRLEGGFARLMRNSTA